MVDQEEKDDKEQKPLTFGENREKICERCKTIWPGGLFCRFCGGRLLIAETYDE